MVVLSLSWEESSTYYLFSLDLLEIDLSFLRRDFCGRFSVGFLLVIVVVVVAGLECFPYRL